MKILVYNMVMLVTAMFQWWYTAGWKTFFNNFSEKLQAIADQFSIGLLLKTLFAPFRQIDSDHLDNVSISERFQSFIARTISRFIGALIRTFVILAGIIVLFFTTIFGFIFMLVWPLIPTLPIICIILKIAQVVF